MPKVNIQKVQSQSFSGTTSSPSASVPLPTTTEKVVEESPIDTPRECCESVTEPLHDFNDLTRNGFEKVMMIEQQQKENDDFMRKLILEKEKEQKQLNKTAEKERIKLDAMEKKANEKAMKEALKRNKKSPTSEENDSLFGDPTPIIGRSRRELLTKITQYKALFKEELKTFKIKKDPSEKELNDAVNEIEAIVSTSCVDTFLLEGILSSIRVIEGVSSLTKNYDISGMADMLKMNPEFIKNAKLLFIKYNCYCNVPPEGQMLFIIATTALICRQKNAKKNEINAFLDSRPM